MKNINQNIISLIKTGSQILLITGLLFVIFQLQQCKKDDPSPNEKAQKLLTSTEWKIGSVTVDGVDATSLFTGFKLTIAPKTYTTQSGGVVWPASGTWEFADATGTKVTRDASLEINIQTLTSDQLVMNLQWDKNTYGGGRTNSIKGKHVFTMMK